LSDSLKFGTSGLRGLAIDFTDDAVRLWTRRFLALARPEGLLVGRDLRASSPRIADAVLAASAEAGVAAHDCGVLPTPALALEALRRGHAAIMVTGSHIPADRNGLKFYTAAGELTKAEEAQLVVMGEPTLMSVADGSRSAGTGAIDAYRQRYLDHSSIFDLSGMRIGIYEHSSVARDLFADVFTALGADAFGLARSDVFVPIDTEAVSAEDSARAAEWARDHRLDAIVSTDGDADRPLIADETGAFLRGDLVGLATAAFLKAGTVVTPVTSSAAPEMSGLFDLVLRTKVGSPFVLEAMAGEGLAGPVVGYEANGGVMLGSDTALASGTLSTLPTRDALLPILSVLSLARQKSVPLSGLEGLFPKRFTRSDRIVDVERNGYLAVVEPLSDRLPPTLAQAGMLREIDRTDGVKLLLEGGDSLHFRASGNAPELRCYAEAASRTRADALLQLALGHARGVLGR
jgi:phosphomannomutase